VIEINPVVSKLLYIT